jgi:hypothetical protein
LDGGTIAIDHEFPHRRYFHAGAVALHDNWRPPEGETAQRSDQDEEKCG